MATEQILTEVEVNGEESDEVVNSEENVANYYVPYIDNGFILKHFAKEGNRATARMLLSLPLCRIKDVDQMAARLSKLKNKRDRLNKQKSADGVAALNSFLDAEFVFPESSGEER